MIIISQTGTRAERTLTPEAFDRLLACLDEDRERAALKYETLRQGLATFFAFRGLADPHALADETFNRAAHRLAAGAELYADNPASYFYAIARNLWRETVARPYRAVPLPEDWRAPEAQSLSPEELLAEMEARLKSEQRLACLDRCLQELAAPERELIVQYYHGAADVKIANRQTLAARLGVQQQTLRKRASRLRARLGECLSNCLGAAAAELAE